MLTSVFRFLSHIIECLGFHGTLVGFVQVLDDSLELLVGGGDVVLVWINNVLLEFLA